MASRHRVRLRSVEAVQNQRIANIRNTTQEILSWDNDNKYPTRVSNSLDASPTGVMCFRKMVAFLLGKGFEDTSLNTRIVNYKRQTVFNLLSQLVKDLAKYNCFHIHINYNLNLEAVSLTRINPKFVRLGLPDSMGFSPKVAIHPNWDFQNHESPDRNPIVDYINVFAPENVALQIEQAGGIDKYRGQVYSYWGEEQSYPLALYDNVVNDLAIDALMSQKYLGDINAGFSPNVIFFFRERLSDEDYNQKVNRYNASVGPNGNRVMMFDGVEDKEAVWMETIDPAVHDGQFEETSRQVRSRIMRAFGQIPILHGEERNSALGGDGKAIENAYRLV